MLERAFAEQKALLAEQHQALFGFLGSLKEAVRQSEQNFMRFVHLYADEAVRQRKELAAVPSRLVRLYQAQLAAGASCCTSTYIFAFHRVLFLRWIDEHHVFTHFIPEFCISWHVWSMFLCTSLMYTIS